MREKAINSRFERKIGEILPSLWFYLVKGEVSPVERCALLPIQANIKPVY